MVRRLTSLIPIILILMFSISGPSPRHNTYVQEKKKNVREEAKRKFDKIRAELKKLKAELAENEVYICCIEPACDFCGLSVNGCRCGKNLSEGKPVCMECKAGWMAGYGALPDVKPEDVKSAPPKALKMMFDAKAKNYGSTK